MQEIVVDAGPFIHLEQIKEIALLQKFPALYAPVSVISEISFSNDLLREKIRLWKNLKIIHIQERIIPDIERIIKKFRLHKGEEDILYLARRFNKPVILTDDLSARTAAESLKLEVHGTVGIIAYSFQKGWLSFKRAEQALLLLQRKSNLFITSAIIERAIQELGKTA